MTLRQAITSFRTRFGVDNDCEFDLDDDNLCTDAINRAAKIVSRETNCIFRPRSQMTGLAAGDKEYNFLTERTVDPNYPWYPIFQVIAIHLNGGWLQQQPIDTMTTVFTDYTTHANSDHPTTYWMFAGAGGTSCRFYEPPSSTCAAALDNFCVGWQLHPTYNFPDNQDDDLLIPDEMSDLLVDKAFLMYAKSYVSSPEGVRRYQMIEDSYTRKASRYKQNNIAQFTDNRRRGDAGRDRRVIFPYGTTNW